MQRRSCYPPPRQRPTVNGQRITPRSENVSAGDAGPCPPSTVHRPPSTVHRPPSTGHDAATGFPSNNDTLAFNASGLTGFRRMSSGGISAVAALVGISFVYIPDISTIFVEAVAALLLIA